MISKNTCIGILIIAYFDILPKATNIPSIDEKIIVRKNISKVTTELGNIFFTKFIMLSKFKPIPPCLNSLKIVHKYNFR